MMQLINSCGGSCGVRGRRFGRLYLRLAGTVIILAVAPTTATAATQRKTPTKTAPVAKCSAGLRLHLSSPVSSQGSVLLAEVRDPRALEEVKGEWAEKEIPFWRQDESQNKSGTAWRGLIGVDLEQAAGEYKFAISAKTQNAEPLSCSMTVPVRQGRFATERLQVEKQFVQPDPEQSARAQAEGQRLREIFATVTPERLWDGPFRVPLAGVTIGKNFGRRRILNGQPRSPHSGVDFPAPAGTPVYAAQSGRVVLAEPLFFSGNTVVVDHGLGVYTFYAHLESLTVNPGETVAAGALLGNVGATGRVTGPHLHWGLTVNRARVNPLQLVKLLGVVNRGRHTN